MRLHIRIISVTLTLIAVSIAGADDDDEMAIDTFLAYMRQPPIELSWGIFEGTVSHKRDGKRQKKVSVELRARFSSERVSAQLIFNDDQVYMIGQNFLDGLEGTTIHEQRAAQPGAVTLADRGIRPSDLTLSFLYWDFVEELDRERFGGRVCRVVRLRNPQVDETVKIWVSRKYIFPMAVEWFSGEREKPYRRLEFKDLKKINDIYVIDRIAISNAGWRTIVQFKKIQLAKFNDSPVPDDLFRKID